MTSLMSTGNEHQVQVAGRAVRVVSHGDGEALVVLHHSTGNPGWLPFYDRLAESYSLRVPDLPGYGQSERPEWARSPRDLAILTHLLLDHLDLDGVHLVGLGLGGWVAAEMATLNQHRLASLVLVGAPGLRPGSGEIVDQVLLRFEEYVRMGFAGEEAFETAFGAEPAPELFELWDLSREMTARIAWKPWMFSRQLPHLLGEIRTPTLVVWGESDRVVPLDCGRQYAESIPNARLEVVAGAGHAVDFERPDELARLVSGHIARTASPPVPQP